MHHPDMVVHPLLALRKFESTQVRTFDKFLPGREEFLVFSSGHPILNWQTARMKELGWRLEPLGENADGQLYRAYAPKPHS
ncbi:hypothetical protein [uncultured Paludibaculum sp.]|uniref:hypothetical protein n=1 Tax=uncultured Paludibaculum sp. TaxID=1765020 RepID=UPI002AAAFA06|nr:hypothetical protein [uncultured Paludibaculum sp.]